MDEKLFAGRVYQLRKFKRKHGHLRLGRTTDLAKWLARMKRYQHVGLLGQDKEAVLRAAGVTFDGDRQPSPKHTRRRQYADTTAGDQEWEVEAILDKRMVAAADDPTPPAPLYEVKWKGYDETTWEPLANLVGCAELLKEFESARQNAEKQTAASPPPSPSAQAAAAVVAQAPEAAEARRLAVYSNFPEVECTVALRLSGGCRDLALLWLHTEPREREWLESSVFRCRADQARRELGLPLDRPTAGKAEATTTATTKARSQRAKRKRDNDVDENDDSGPGDDYVDDDDDYRASSSTTTTTTATATTTRPATKRVKTEAVSSDDDVGKERERGRGGGKWAQAAEEERARREAEEERARKNLAKREERKAMRDRKMAEDWERQRAQVRQAREQRRQQLLQQQQQQQLQRQQQQQHLRQQLQLQQQQQQQQQHRLQQQQQQQQQQQKQKQRKQHLQQHEKQQKQHLQHHEKQKQQTQQTQQKQQTQQTRASDPDPRAQPTKLNEGAQHNSVATCHWTTTTTTTTTTSRGDEEEAELKAKESEATRQRTTTSMLIDEEDEEQEEEELKAMECGSNTNVGSGGVADDGEMWEEDPLLAGSW